MTDAPHEAARAGVRPGPTLAGIALVVLYARIGAVLEYRVEFGGGPASLLNHVGPGEFLFWTCHALILVPGVIALAWGLAPWAVPAWQRGMARIDALGARAWRGLALGWLALLFAIARGGRWLVLLDMPITDDENAVRFGARMLAEGDLRVPMLEPALHFTNLYTYVSDGMVASLDFPGTLLFAALGEWLGTPQALYAAAAACTGLAVVATANAWLGRRAAILAGLLWLFSPMATTLSFTTHAHVASRLGIALALLCLAHLSIADTAARRRRWAALLGFVTAAAFLVRPAEVASFMLAPGVYLVARALGGGTQPRTELALAALCALPPLLFLAWYDWQITGHPFVLPRMGEGVTNITPRSDVSPWVRLGSHTGFNVLMLCIWFLGPLGLPLAALGVERRRGWTTVLGGGVLCALAITLLHDNVGIHMVGPIHYSELAVPLTLLAAAGIERASAWAARLQWPEAGPQWLLAGYCFAAMGLFLLGYTGQLRAQAEYVAAPLRALERAGVENAVVMAPPPAAMNHVHGFRLAGSWMLQFPHPDPYLRDDILFVRRDADLAALRRHLPGREVYALEYRREPPYFELRWIERPAAGTPHGAAARSGEASPQTEGRS